MGQGVHSLELEAENWPTGQLVHEDAAVREYWPGAQGPVQAAVVSLEVAPNLPAGQAVHSLAFAGEKLPM